MVSPSMASHSDLQAAAAPVSDPHAQLLGMAKAHFQRLRTLAGLPRFARVGQIRGTGPGVSFATLVNRLEASYPVSLRSPFEGSDRIAGGVYRVPRVVSPATPTDHTDAIAKLRWSSGASDLPMHVHTDSDRVIFVLSGRGFFHVSGQPADAFNGESVTTIAARERDVFVFSRGVVHTFSTFEHPMTLISCQLPHIPFDCPRQYRLPHVSWKASDHLNPPDGEMWLTPGFDPVDR